MTAKDEGLGIKVIVKKTRDRAHGGIFRKPHKIGGDVPATPVSAVQTKAVAAAAGRAAVRGGMALRAVAAPFARGAVAVARGPASRVGAAGLPRGARWAVAC